MLWVVAVLWAGGWWTVLATVPTTCSDGPCADTNSMAFTFLLLGTPPLVLVAILATVWAIVAAIRRRR